MKKFVFVIGTRPELIKMMPIIKYASKVYGRDSFIIIDTAQHKTLSTIYWKLFGFKPDHVLDVLAEGQSLNSLASKIILQLEQIFKPLLDAYEICGIVGQGDTTTVMATSIFAFNSKIRFFHVEAGLRTHDIENPFPEELNRQITSRVSYINFAPTRLAKKNLLNEGIAAESIRIVGNTIVDAIQIFINDSTFKNHYLGSKILNDLHEPFALITCHRRENHGHKLLEIISAVTKLAEKHNSLKFLWLLHPNPNVRNVILNSPLLKFQNIILHEPVDYLDILNLIQRSKIILTDSGGIQEEAPTFGKPVLILRSTTERPEAVLNGKAILVDTDQEKILNGFAWAINYTPKNLKNPYGDGKASKKIVDTIYNTILNLDV